MWEDMQIKDNGLYAFIPKQKETTQPLSADHTDTVPRKRPGTRQLHREERSQGDREPGTETAMQESRPTQAMPESKTQARRPRSQQRERPSESEGGEGAEGPAPVATGDYDSDHSLSTCTIPHASHSPLIFPTRQVCFTLQTGGRRLGEVRRRAHSHTAKGTGCAGLGLMRLPPHAVLLCEAAPARRKYKR